MPERLRPLPSQLTQLQVLVWRVCPPEVSDMSKEEFVDAFMERAKRCDRATVQDLIRDVSRMIRETEKES